MIKYLKWIWLIIKAIFKKPSVVSFTKEHDDRWYVDFPNWPLAHYHLMMVAGSDTLLEILHNGTNHVSLKVKTSNKEKSIPRTIELVKIKSTITGGAYYKLKTPLKDWDRTSLWLCPVTLAVLGHYPKYIYIKKLNEIRTTN